MPIDPAKRQANYDAMVTPARTSDVVDVQLGSMKNNHASKQNAIYQMEVQVRQVINGAGCSVIQFPFYLCFGREMWKKSDQGITGEALAVEAAILIAKWVARGLTQGVLQAIRSQVFNIGAPVSP